MSRLKFSAAFGTKWAALDAAGRERLQGQILRFEAAPQAAGFNLEPMQGRAGLFSFRIGGGDRVLLRRCDNPDADWVLEDFGPHDIYRKVSRR